jgi:hypothetical protein
MAQVDVDTRDELLDGTVGVDTRDELLDGTVDVIALMKERQHALRRATRNVHKVAKCADVNGIIFESILLYLNYQLPLLNS